MPLPFRNERGRERAKRGRRGMPGVRVRDRNIPSPSFKGRLGRGPVPFAKRRGRGAKRTQGMPRHVCPSRVEMPTAFSFPPLHRRNVRSLPRTTTRGTKKVHIILPSLKPLKSRFRQKRHPLPQLPQPRIQPVSQPIPEKVQRHHRQK